MTTKDVDVFVALPKSARDHDRVSRFLEQDALEIARFEAILTRHEPMEKWREFQQRYCSDQP